MATALAEQSSRYGQVTTLQGVVANASNGSLGEQFFLPAGYGDVLILDVQLVASGSATFPVAAPIIPVGMAVLIQPVNGSTYVQTVGVGQLFIGYITSGIHGYVKPEVPALLREVGEYVSVYTGQIDSNVSPTADFSVYFTVKKLRSLGAGT